MTDVATALSKLDAVRDVMTVRQVYGDPYDKDGVTVIPVAEVRGGGGGGGGGDGGNGADSNGAGQGSGTGVGFGVKARPTGVFAVKDGNVTWVPAVDVTRIVVGGQVVALAALFLLRSALRRRR